MSVVHGVDESEKDICRWQVWTGGCSELTWPLRQKWFWMLFLALLAVLLGAFAVVSLIAILSPASLFLMLIVVLVAWFVFRSYRKWVTSKSDEEGGSSSAREQFLTWFSDKQASLKHCSTTIK